MISVTGERSSLSPTHIDANFIPVDCVTSSLLTTAMSVSYSRSIELSFDFANKLHVSVRPLLCSYSLLRTVYDVHVTEELKHGRMSVKR